MNGKVQTVELFNSVLDSTEAFEITHAERLLRMRNNGGWTLPEDSQYTFENDGIRIKENTGAIKSPRKEKNDR